jgi:hypothetical protein
LSEFEERWKWITKRAGGESNVVQDRQELEHIYNLIEGESYLEVGTAEGDSLYVLGHKFKKIDFVDYGETHTREKREQVLLELAKLPDAPSIIPHLGDSTSSSIALSVTGKYDCVLIDGGHDFATVLSDAIVYGTKATKYIFFHDVQLPQVRAAVEWFVKHWSAGEYTTFINSENYGYGVVKFQYPPLLLQHFHLFHGMFTPSVCSKAMSPIGLRKYRYLFSLMMIWLRQMLTR